MAFLAAYDREFQASDGFFTRRYFRLQPLLGYSLRHWADHARICQDAGALHPCIYTYFSAYPKLLQSDASDKDARFNSVAPHRSYTDIRRLPGLHVAILHGLTDVIKAKILPFEVEDDGEDGYTPFHFAALYSKPDSLQALIASYDGVNVRSIPRGQTALHIAIEKLTDRDERTRTLRILASNPTVNPNIPNSTGMTPLMVAARPPSSDYDAELALRILCSRVDIDIGVEDSQGRTAFWHACSKLGAGSLFLSHYPDVDANTSDHEGVTPFMMACRHGSLDLVLRLLNRGDIDTDIQDSRGRTPSFYAFERDIIARPLLSSLPGINLGLRDSEGTTLFMVACESGSTGVVQELLASGGDDGPSYVHQVDSKGRTALVRCCAGIAVDQAGRHGRDIINLLLRHGSDPRVHDHVEGRTPLMWAVSIGDLSTSKQLLAFEPSRVLDQRDNRGRSILMLAAQTGQFSIFSFVHALVERQTDADPYNAQDVYGRTALMYACERGNREIISILLQHPWIEVGLRDRARRTAVDWALHRDGLQQDMYLCRHLASVLFGHPSWTRSAIRKAVIGIAAQPSSRSWRRDFVFRYVLHNLEEVIAAFDWTLDHEDTIVLLAAVSSGRGCRSYARLILSYCYPSPGSDEVDRPTTSSPVPCDVGSCPQCDYQRLCAPMQQVLPNTLWA